MLFPPMFLVDSHITSVVRAFDASCFLYSSLVPEQRHIRARPKGMAFGLRCEPKP